MLFTSDAKTVTAKRTRQLLVAGLILLALMAVPSYRWLASPTTAPHIEFVLVNGKPLALTSLRHQAVLVNFWSLSCHSCMEELPQTLAHYRTLRPQGVEIIAVTTPFDPPAEVVKFQRRRQLPYPVALDLQGRVAQAFGGIPGTPTWILIAPGGDIVWRHSGRLDWNALTARITPYLKHT